MNDRISRPIFCTQEVSSHPVQNNRRNGDRIDTKVSWVVSFGREEGSIRVAYIPSMQGAGRSNLHRYVLHCVIMLTGFARFNFNIIYALWRSLCVSTVYAKCQGELLFRRNVRIVIEGSLLTLGKHYFLVPNLRKILNEYCDDSG